MRRFSCAYQLESPEYNTCPNCSALRRPHRVCGCGYYDGKKVLTVVAKAAADAPSASN
ncbi:MAG: 50S ribosomal protein L32 [Bdellovibrionota bacterium]